MLILFVVTALLGSCVTDYTEDTLRELEVVRKVDIKNDTETVTAKSNGHQYKAVLRLRAFTQHDVQDHKYWFGVDGDLPRRVVESIRVERDGQEMTIPERVYSDFADIPCEPQQWRIQLFTEGDKLLMRYAGSDGAGSYAAKFYFSGESFDHATIPSGGRTVVRN